MTKFWPMAALAIALTTAACGGSDNTREIDCEANLRYQDRVEGRRVVAPEGLDQLDQLAEMPIPRADPDAPRSPASMCNDRPPVIVGSG